MSRCLQIVACGCPPARYVDNLVSLAQQDDWSVFVTVSPSGAKWAPISKLEQMTGYPVRVNYRGADEPKTVPECDALIVCPATVNTINKWACGISDTLALGAMVEAVGRDIPIVAVPFSNPAHKAHPAFRKNLRDLRDWGISIIDLGPEAMRQHVWSESAAGSPWASAMQALSRLVEPESD